MFFNYRNHPMLARARIIQVMFSGFLVSQKKTFFMDFYKINLIWIFGKKIHIQQLSIKLVRITAHLITEFRTLKKNVVLDTTLCDKVCQWLAAGLWFCPGTTVTSINKTDHHDITEILLKVALNTITLTPSLWSFKPNK